MLAQSASTPACCRRTAKAKRSGVHSTAPLEFTLKAASTSTLRPSAFHSTSFRSRSWRVAPCTTHAALSRNQALRSPRYRTSSMATLQSYKDDVGRKRKPDATTACIPKRRAKSRSRSSDPLLPLASSDDDFKRGYTWWGRISGFLANSYACSIAVRSVRLLDRLRTGRKFFAV